MSRDSRKVARKRQKRGEMRRATHRPTSRSPNRLVGREGETVACFVNRDWKEQGMASFHVFKRSPGGGTVMASFLVDIWCMGLKDAWGLLDTSVSEFEERYARIPHQPEVELMRVEIDLAQRLVVGGIRFARQNGFRLPKRYERWTAVLGDLGDVDQADLTDFRQNGRLFFSGPLDDLQKRLIGCSVNEFLSRSDVEYLRDGDGESFLLPDEELEFQADTEAMKERLVDAVKSWCFSRSVSPHPRVRQAAELLLDMHMAMPADSVVEPDDFTEDDGDAVPIFEPEALGRSMEQMLSLLPGDEQMGVMEAFDQVVEFMQAHPWEEVEAILTPDDNDDHDDE